MFLLFPLSLAGCCVCLSVCLLVFILKIQKYIDKRKYTHSTHKYRAQSSEEEEEKGEGGGEVFCYIGTEPEIDQGASKLSICQRRLSRGLRVCVCTVAEPLYSKSKKALLFYFIIIYTPWGSSREGERERGGRSSGSKGSTIQSKAS